MSDENILSTSKSDLLERLTQQGTELRDLMALQAAAEQNLKELSDKINHLKSVILPSIMKDLNMASFSLEDGTSFKHKEMLKAKIPDALRAEAFAWLETSGNGSVIKNSVIANFERGQGEIAKEIYQFIMDKGIGEVIQKEDVHPKTLESLVNELVKSGQLVPFDLFGITPVSTVSVTKK